MKILKRTLILAAAYYLMVVVAGCYGKCEQQRYKSYACEGLEVGIMEYEFGHDSTFSPHIFMDDSLPAINYGLSLNFSISKFAQQGNIHKLNLINSAHAWKCEEPSIFPKDTIREIQVLTLNDFDPTHPKGSDVSDYFVVLRKEYNPARIERHPLEYLANKPDYIHEQMISYNTTIYLNTAPANPGYAQFEVTVQFNNEKVLTAVSDEVFLK